MKDGLEVAEGVKTASSATNGGGDKCDMRSLDEYTHRNGVAEVAADINALPVGGTLISDTNTTGDKRQLEEYTHRNGVAEVAGEINGLTVGGTLIGDTNGGSDKRSRDEYTHRNGVASDINGTLISDTNGDHDKSDKNGFPKNGSKEFECSICKRSFGYKHVLQNHERTHTGEKPFECPECHKRFTRDHHLKTHMRLHTGEKPYQCSHCDRHFVQVANLRRHLRVHTGERPYACERCESRFSDSNQLKAHMLIHRGEKPFQCQDCLGRYRRRHHLIHHKCPKNDNGAPRRGRRPKAYEKMTGIDPGEHEDHDDEELLQLSDNEENIADSHNSSSEIDHPSPESVHSGNSDVSVNSVNSLNSTVVHTNNNNNNNHHQNHEELINPLMVVNNGVVTNGNRRKPSKTIRILTPQQREIFLRDKMTMQTQAIDMSLSPSAVDVQPVTVIVPNRFLSSVEGVLDLSSSRSDSEIEAIEEEVHFDEDCQCHVKNYRRSLSQQIVQRSKILGIATVMQPMSVRRINHLSDDSSDSQPHMNGVKHLSDDDKTMAIPLTTKKAHIATA